MLSTLKYNFREVATKKLLIQLDFEKNCRNTLHTCSERDIDTVTLKKK